MLAAASNFLAERGAAVVHSTWVVHTPLTQKESVRQAVTPLVAASAASAAATDTATILAQITVFDSALQERLSEATARNADGTYRSARTALQKRGQQFLAIATLGGTKSTRSEFEHALHELLVRSDELTSLSDQGHVRREEYLQRVDAMHDRAKRSLDGALKLFGRVIARQYLIHLRDQVEVLRRVAGGLQVHGTSTADLSTITTAEAQVTDLLTKDATRLAKSEGRPWYDDMQHDLSWIASNREAVQRLDAQFEQAQTARAAATLALRDSVARVATAKAQLTLLPPTPTHDVAPVAGSVNAIDDAPEKIVERIDAQTGDIKALIRWISLGVLALLLLISVATVRSIVKPVRSLMRATQRIAAGEESVQADRGGIKELDTLSAAFNQMAGQIAAARLAARNYQEELERRVEDRTRQLQQLAENDPLTGLPNRRQLLALLSAALVDADRRGTKVGVLFLDLDNFKNINDGLGHAYGDQLLIEVANRLQALSAGYGFAARLGGDEFIVVHVGGDSLDGIFAASEALVKAFESPIELGGRGLLISISAGVSVYPDEPATAEGLLRAADTALFCAKAQGRSQFVPYTPDLLANAAARFRIEQGLRHAVEGGDLVLVFQPEVHSDAFEPRLVEALLRWRQPDGRLASPGEYLDVAEESGLILEISDWVLRTAIETAAHWHHGAWPEARVAINVSSRELFDQRFVDRILALLAQHRLPARCIEIELTETLLQTGPGTIEALGRLRDQGIAIALDDFGTGYSSITSLEALPITRVKLDRSLIEKNDTSPRAAAIATSTIGLCHRLGLEITAEGIERPEQLAVLLAQGPLYLQGFLIARPMAGSDVVAAIEHLPQHMQTLLLALPGTASRTDSVQVLRARNRPLRESRS